MTKSETDYLKELVAFPSVSADKEASKACAEFCAEFFKTCGLYTELVESNGYPNIVATSQNTKTPKVLLQCHMDVVPAKDELFKMKRSGGKLFGRGAFDMKFACASYMKLAEQLGQDISKYDFGIMLSFDEEIGGHNGVEALLKQGYGADIAILPDSGKDWHLEATGNGAWFLKLSKKGKNAHGSMPHKGINAAEILTTAIYEIQKLREDFDKTELTLSLTKLSSGKAMNQIPDHAEAVLDIRYKTNTIYERLEKQIDVICKKHGVNKENIELFSCVDVNTDQPSVNSFIKTAEDVIGRKIPTSHSVGATDARYFCAHDIPCIVIQPNGGSRHADGEWVDEEGVRHLTQILHRYIIAEAER